MADAYHATALPGCHTRRRMDSGKAGSNLDWTPAANQWSLQWRQLRKRCSVRSSECSSFCDKSVAEVMIDGQLKFVWVHRLAECRLLVVEVMAAIDVVEGHFAGLYL
jgi:hypothetical protein